MPLPFVTESLESIPAEHQALYVEKDGKFRLDVDGYEDPTNLKTALQKEREAARNADKQAKAWAALGKTPEEIQQLVEAQRQADEQKLSQAGEWEKLKAQMNEQHARDKQALQDALTAKDRAIEQHLIDAQATAAIAELRGVARLLMPHVKASVKVIEQDGQHFVRVVDQAGNARVNGSGDFLTIRDLVSEMRQSDDFGRAFEANGTTGSGAGASAAGTQRFDPKKLAGTKAERLAAIREKIKQ